MRLKVRFHFGHVQTYSWLHRLRNTQGEIYGTYLRNIYGIYKEYTRNVHKYLWHKIIRNTDPMGQPPKAAAPLGRHRRRRPCFWSFYIIDISGYSLHILCIFHIYFLAMFHIFSLVCFLIYGVKSRSGHARSQSFGPIWHVSGPKLTFWGNFIMVLHGFAARSLKNMVFPSKNINIRPTT